MKSQCVYTRAALALVSSFFLLAASAADRPAKQNKAFNAQALNGFPAVATGVAVKIKSASIAKDGTITAALLSPIPKAPAWM